MQDPEVVSISIVTDTFPPDINGVAMTLERLAAGLIRRGHPVEVIHPGRRGEPSENPRGAFQEWVVPGFRVPGLGQAGMGWPQGSQLRERWSARRPGVIYVATEGMLGASAIRAARLLKIPVISGYHTHLPTYLSGYRLQWLGPWLLRWLRHVHNSTQCTLVPNEATFRILSDQGFRNLGVLGRGVDTQLFHPARRDPVLRARWGAAAGDPVILSVGRLAPEKDPQLVLRAWDLIRSWNRRSRLVVVGDGPLKQSLQARCPEAIWTGFLSGPDLAAAYASADLLLFPSRTETFGNVLLEAMASGLVTVSCHLAASQQFIEPGHNGYASSLDSPDAWLRQVLRAVREYRRWPQMAAAARLSVKNQSWDHTVRQFERWLCRATGAAESISGTIPPLLPPLPHSA